MFSFMGTYDVNYPFSKIITNAIEIINYKSMGLIRFINKALKRDKKALVVLKTDDEMTRYLK